MHRSRTAVTPGQRERGFALLVVLWSLVLLGLLTTRLVASGRTAVTLAGNLRAAAQARAVADGAINAAVFHVLATGAAHWPSDGAVHRQRAGRLAVSVRIHSLAGMINPNLASPALLAGLFVAVGAAPRQAHALARAVIAWRSPPLSGKVRAARIARYRQVGRAYGPPGRRFASLTELGNVRGMTPALLAKCRPHMSLYWHGAPDPAAADPVVRHALALAGLASRHAGTGLATPVIVVDARVTGPGPVSVHRRAIVRVPGPEALTPFRFVTLATAE